jgi:acetyl-CoA acetyltransferase
MSPSDRRSVPPLPCDDRSVPDCNSEAVGAGSDWLFPVGALVIADLRSKAVIVGVGETEFSRSSSRSSLALTAEAFKAALTDAGLSHDDVDGIATHLGTPYGDDYDRMAYGLGLNIRHAAQYFTHGRFITLALQNAAAAVATGLADVVACIHTFKTDSMSDTRWVAKPGEEDREGAREGGGPHGQQPAFGLTSMTAGVAMAARRYLQTYGLHDDALMPVALSARLHAALNPRALLRDAPLTADAYLAEQFSMDPIRPSDGAIYGDGSVVVLVVSPERARSLGKPPVYIRGMQGMRAGREEFLFGPRGLGVMQQGTGRGVPEKHPHQVFDMADVRPPDIDGFYTYDIYSPIVLFALERFGHCEPGGAARFAGDGQIAPGGRLPVNTGGGLLAEIHMCGWNMIAEIVRQIRGEAGAGQLQSPGLLQWAGAAGDSIIFGGEP